MPREDDDGYEPCNLGEGTIVRQTDKAIQVETKNHGTIWVPISCLHDDSEVYASKKPEDGKSGKLVVMNWFARKEGLD